MKSTLLTSAFLFLASLSLFAEKIDMNGDFEKCKPDPSGIILPEGWLINKTISRKCEILITKEKDEVRNGKFALRIENESDGKAYLMKWQPVTVQPGDRIKCSIWARGKGKIALGFLTYGTPEGRKNSDFLGTTAWPLKMVNHPDAWKETGNVYTVAQMKKDNVAYTKLILIPVIYVENGAELCLDDYTFERTGTQETVK